MIRAGLRVRLLVCVVPLALAACGGSVAEKKNDTTLAPADPRAARVYLDGVKQMAHGKAGETRAAQSFEEALRIDPKLWEAHYNLGVLYRRRGETRKALPHFQRAHDMQRAAREPLTALAEARHELGERDAASELLAQYVKAHPEALEVRLALTSVLREGGHFDAALEAARECLVRDPANTRALLEVGRIYRAKGDHDVAELVFEKALALDGKNAQAHNDLGLLALARGDTQLAFDRFEKAVAADPAFAPARMNRASVLLRAGDYASAQSEYDKVLAVDAHQVDARVGLGVALRGLGKHAEAERAYEAALVDAPNHVAALFNLGVLRAEFLDRRPQARELFVRYLDLAANDDERRAQAERYLVQIPASAPPPPAAAPAAPKAQNQAHKKVAK